MFDENENEIIVIQKPNKIDEIEYAPAELPYLFEKEIINKQNKKIYILTDYVATEKVIPIEGKFHTKYEVNNIKDFRKKIQQYTKVIDKLERKPFEKYDFPILESQEYGWVESKLLQNDKNQLCTLNRMHAPKLRCNLTRYGEKLNSEKHTERPKFHGTRFFC